MLLTKMDTFNQGLPPCPDEATRSRANGEQDDKCVDALIRISGIIISPLDTCKFLAIEAMGLETADEFTPPSTVTTSPGCKVDTLFKVIIRRVESRQ